MWVSWLMRSKSRGSRLNREDAARLSWLRPLEEAFASRLRKDLIEIIEVLPAARAQLLDQVGPALQLVVDGPLGAGVQAASRSDPMLQEIAVAVADELENVLGRVPAKDLDEGEGIAIGVVVYDFADGRDAATHLAVRQPNHAAEDHNVQVVHVHLGNVDGMAGETLGRVFHGGGVEGGHDGVPRLPGLKGHGSLLATDLAHND